MYKPDWPVLSTQWVVTLDLPQLGSYNNEKSVPNKTKAVWILLQIKLCTVLSVGHIDLVTMVYHQVTISRGFLFFHSYHGLSVFPSQLFSSLMDRMYSRKLVIVSPMFCHNLINQTVHRKYDKTNWSNLHFRWGILNMVWSLQFKCIVLLWCS